MSNSFIDPFEYFILNHPNVLYDLKKRLIFEIINKYLIIKNIEEIKALKRFQELYNLNEGEMELFGADILEDLKTSPKHKGFINKVDDKRINNYKTLKNLLNLIIDDYFLNSGLIENINNEEYIIYSYDNYLLFKEKEFKQLLCFTHTVNNKHKGYIKKSKFIKMFIKHFNYSFREIKLVKL